MSFGGRLKEERKRLKLTQPQLAEKAGTTKSTQLLYEKDTIKANSEYLAAIAKIGIDVVYVLTGVRGGMLLTAEEATLLTRYRSASVTLRSAAMAVLGATDTPAPVHEVKTVTVGRDNKGSINM